jgi:small subunit ribosomal protein S1
MSKKILKPSQFSRAFLVDTDDFVLSPEQQQELDSLFASSTETIKAGKLISGKVLSVDSNGVVVDISYKSNGVIPRYEFTEHELKDLKEGNEIDVLLDELENTEGNVILSYDKAKALKAWARITKLFEDGKPVEGVVTHTVKGGLSVDIGVPAFLPGSQVDIQRVVDFNQYIGQKVIADIIKINKKRGNVIISRRKHLSSQRADARRKAMESLHVGQIIQGVVKNITNYGVFIDIGGVDGLLHITDMTWGRIAHPSELVKIGDTITVKVLSIDEENSKISLGMKQLSENPWAELKENIQAGSKIKGIISSITEYGMFVEIQKGVEGLVHISEISWTDRVSDLNKMYKVGQEIEVYVVSFDKENRRMSLSIKQLEQNPWKQVAESYKIGSKISGTISNITDFGIFVQLLPGVDGLVHVSDLSWTEHINHPSDLYKKGQTVEAVILGIDEENKKVSLGIKQLTQDPWEAVEQEFQAGKIVEGEVSKITNFGAFIRLASGIEGLVHISEFSDKDGEKIDQVLHVGDKRQFRVVSVNKSEHKVGLSTKLEAEAAENKKPKAAKKSAEARTNAASKSAEPSVKPKSQMQLELEKLSANKK